jgi:hypothetical protein
MDHGKCPEKLMIPRESIEDQDAHVFKTYMFCSCVGHEGHEGRKSLQTIIKEVENMAFHLRGRGNNKIPRGASQ